MPYAPTTGISLYYEVIGNGPRLCLISGYRQSSAAWPRQFIMRLANRYQTIIFDNRGTGLSDHPQGGYDIMQFGRCLKRWRTWSVVSYADRPQRPHRPTPYNWPNG